MVKCSGCGADCDKGRRMAAISGSIMGDQCTDTYILCAACGAYTVEVYREPFLGENEVSFRGPVPVDEGDAAVALIRQCKTPWDKKCRCAAHVAYFRGTLD